MDKWGRKERKARRMTSVLDFGKLHDLSGNGEKLQQDMGELSEVNPS